MDPGDINPLYPLTSLDPTLHSIEIIRNNENIDSITLHNEKEDSVLNFFNAVGFMFVRYLLGSRHYFRWVAY